jgi:hypothetical protein
MGHLVQVEGIQIRPATGESLRNFQAESPEHSNNGHDLAYKTFFSSAQNLNEELLKNPLCWHLYC